MFDHFRFSSRERSSILKFCWRTHFLFFFSSRRRHTRFKCDWSSDVCSSDLNSSAELHVLHVQLLASAVELVARLTRREPPRIVEEASAALDLVPGSPVASTGASGGLGTCRMLEVNLDELVRGLHLEETDERADQRGEETLDRELD